MGTWTRILLFIKFQYAEHCSIASVLLLFWSKAIWLKMGFGMWLGTWEGREEEACQQGQLGGSQETSKGTSGSVFRSRNRVFQGLESQIDLLRWELFNQAPQMDAVNQKANMSVCRESGKPLPARHWVKEGNPRSNIEIVWRVCMHLEQVTWNHSDGWWVCGHCTKDLTCPGREAALFLTVAFPAPRVLW